MDLLGTGAFGQFGRVPEIPQIGIRQRQALALCFGVGLALGHGARFLLGSLHTGIIARPKLSWYQRPLAFTVRCRLS